MRKYTSLITIFGLFILLHSCKKDEKLNLPNVQTLQATEMTNKSVVLKGKVIDENNSAVLKRGFCWSENPNAGLNDSVTNSNFGPGEFSEQLLGLKPSMTYYYKAFAANNNGTSFGDELSFTTLQLAPKITVYNASYNYDSSIAEVKYSVISGSESIVSHGVCYGLTPLPTVLDNVIEQGTSSGLFNCELTNLSLQTKYYVRVFVKDKNEITYSSEHIIITIKYGPTLRFKEGDIYTSKDTTIYINSPIRIGLEGESDTEPGNKLTRFKFSIISYSVAQTLVDSTFSSESFDWETDLSFTGTGKGRLLFELWDKGGMMSSVEFNIVAVAINKYVDVEFGFMEQSRNKNN